MEKKDKDGVKFTDKEENKEINSKKARNNQNESQIEENKSNIKEAQFLYDEKRENNDLKKNKDKNFIFKKISEKFTFSIENQDNIKNILAKYPAGRERSAIMPLLHLAQEQDGGWISYSAMEHIADIIGIPAIKVCEVANFYTMYNKKPIGRYLLQICRTTPCWLCGSDDIMRACKEHLGIEVGETTADGIFTLVEVECLGACTGGPVLQVNNDYYEKLDYQKTLDLLQELYCKK